MIFNLNFRLACFPIVSLIVRFVGKKQKYSFFATKQRFWTAANNQIEPKLADIIEMSLFIQKKNKSGRFYFPIAEAIFEGISVTLFQISTTH